MIDLLIAVDGQTMTSGRSARLFVKIAHKIQKKQSKRNHNADNLRGQLDELPPHYIHC
jgi:hypothetical protein